MNSLNNKIYFELFEESQNGILIYENNRLIDCNNYAVEMFEYKDKVELVNLPFDRLSPIYQDNNEYSNLKYQNMMTICLDDGINRFDWMFITSLNKIFWVEIILKKINIDNTTYIYASIRDISKRKKLEIELKHKLKENNLYKDTLNNYMIVSRTDIDGYITFANDSFCEISGFSKAELIGSSHNIVRDENVPDDFFKDMWQTILSGKTWHGNVQNRNRYGDTYHVKTTIIPVFDENENINEFISIREDITELVKAKDRAIEHEKAKDLLLSKVSHELRTPLNGIKGFSQMLSNTSSNVKDMEYAKLINKETDTLLYLINNLLDVAKFKSEHFELAPTQTNFYLFLSHEIKFFMPMMLEKQIKFINDIDINLPEYILIDAQRLKQVLHNLISNAIKFTPINGKIIFKVEASNGEIIFSVKDSGIGIVPQMQKKIFKEFTQINDNDNVDTSIKGTGLGLSIASSIVKRMDSHIEIKSQPNRGSRFFFKIKPNVLNIKNGLKNKLSNITINTNFLGKDRFYVENFLKSNSITVNNLKDNKYSIFIIENIDMLNKVRLLNKNTLIIMTHENLHINNKNVIATGIENIATLYAALYEIESPQFITNKNTNNYDLNILVVEDYETNQVLLRVILEKLGAQVTIANNGKEALQIYKNNTFDLILTDINMPELDGIDMTRLLHLQKSTIPIYALTADTSIQDNKRFKTANFNGIIHKPFKTSEILEILIKTEKLKLSDNNEILFKEKLLKKLKLPSNIVDELLKTYIKNTSRDLSRLNEAFKSNDIELIKDLSHKLKGSSGMIFRIKTNKAMTKIEELINSNNFNQIEVHINAALSDTIELSGFV